MRQGEPFRDGKVALVYHNSPSDVSLVRATGTAGEDGDANAVV
jgi:hypothetical protein